MNNAMREYTEHIEPEHRPLFNRLHGLILAEHPRRRGGLSYQMPTYKAGSRLLYLGAVHGGRPIYGWQADRHAGFSARHPRAQDQQGTIKLWASRRGRHP
jgi:hypothetical protein